MNYYKEYISISIFKVQQMINVDKKDGNIQI